MSLEKQKVKACPRCGKSYEQSCFHYGYSDGFSVRTEEMPVEEAARLIQYTIHDLESDLESAKAELEEYELLIKQNEELFQYPK